jgi:phenylalanyl-tRNA synthetase alpha chain
LGREIYVRTPVGDLEIGECGLAHPRLLEKAGLPSSASGLAMGLGLDRLVMLIKGIEDIRLLRSSVPKVKEQMYDLYLYRPVSKNPSAKRDISIALWSPVDVELLGDVVRTSLGDLVDSVEEVEVLSHTPYEDLPVSAHERMGLSPGMSNVLLRLRLSRVDGTMTGEEANALRDRIYSILHVGSRSEYASS